MRRVSPSTIAELQWDRERVRNMCILAHIDHGKTTLSDLLVSSNGIISERQAGKLRFLDSMEEEQKRGITIRASAISLAFTPRKKGKPNAPPQPPGAAQDLSTPHPPALGPGNPGDTYLVNLIDSPGHIDFCSDVSTATRSCDGALIIVDAVEGVCVQTNAVLRQAWREGMVPCLVLNKIDRLIVELQLDPLEAWHRLHRIVEKVNALAAALVANRTISDLDAAEDASSSAQTTTPNGGGDGYATEDQWGNLEKVWEFSPERGNVVFASAIDGWGFQMATFARLWASKINAKPKILRSYLWGEYSYHPKDQKVVKYTPSGKLKPMFVSFILEPLWQMYNVCLEEKNAKKLIRRATNIGVTVNERDILRLMEHDSRAALRNVMMHWLPLSADVLNMAVDHMPAPMHAQRHRMDTLFSDDIAGLCKKIVDDPTMHEDISAELAQDIASVNEGAQAAVAACDNSREAPLVAFVAKMSAVSKREIDPEFYDVTADDKAASAGASGNGGVRDAGVVPGEVLVAFTRVFSGVLRDDASIKYYVLGPKHHPVHTALQHVAPVTQAAREAAPFADTQQGEGPSAQTKRLGLYLMMGDSLVRVSEVPAGCICAIAGLENTVDKCATIADSPYSCTLTPIALQARPMIRVAVDATNGKDIPKLELGLRRLHQADPAVEVTVEALGEQVVAALGELHLEQCLKDLETRFACVPIRVSPPLLAFREGLEWTDDSQRDTSPEALGKTQSQMHSQVAQWAHLVGTYTQQGGVGATAAAAATTTTTTTTTTLPSLHRKVKVAISALQDGPQLATPPWSNEDGALHALKGGSVSRMFTSDHRIAVTIRCRPLAPSLATALDTCTRTHSISTHQPLGRVVEACGTALHDVKQALQGWIDECEDITAQHELLALGPRSEGPNMLVRSNEFKVRCHTSRDSFLSVMAHDAVTREAGAEALTAAMDMPPTPTAETAQGTTAHEASPPVFDPAVVMVQVTEAETVNQVWKIVQKSIMSGFQMATASGPLAEEPMYGVCMVVEAVDIVTKPLNDTESPDTTLQSVAGTLATGGPMVGINITKCARKACRVALLSSPSVRLVEGFYSCDLQCEQAHLGSLYGVVFKRRGVVVEEDIIEGTELFLIRALVPVVESIGFSSELLDKTSGAATAPQLAFSHWQAISVDPFWRPTTEDEREEMGESYSTYDVDKETNLARKNMDSVRRRKGLMVEEKVVVAAEKQRTLTRNK